MAITLLTDDINKGYAKEVIEEIFTNQPNTSKSGATEVEATILKALDELIKYAVILAEEDKELLIALVQSEQKVKTIIGKNVLRRTFPEGEY